MPTRFTQRAVESAAHIARAHGLRVDEPVVLAETCAVRVHLAPAPVVARVSTLTAELRAPMGPWLARELEVSAYLAAQGAPVVAPSDLLPPGPHEHDGLAVSFFRHVEPVAGEAASPEVAAAMLAELHGVLRGYPGELPLLAPPRNDIPRGLARIAERGLLPPDDLALLERTAARLLPSVERGALGALQPLHGDAHGGNLIRTAGGLVWNDLEDTCLGPVGWDLVTLGDETALRAYPGAPDPAELGVFRELRRLHAIVWTYALQPDLAAWLPYVEPMLAELRASSSSPP